MAIQRLEALALSDVLGTLLGSVVEAQERSARATVDFVDDVGFEDTADGKQMRTVTLRYTKRDENDEPAIFEVDVPLLSLVNIPSLAVKEAVLSFSYDVVTATSGSETAPRSPLGAVHTKALLTGFVKRRTGGESTERRTTSIDVDVTLTQQEMPIGVERLFDLAELGITERPVAP